MQNTCKPGFVHFEWGHIFNSLLLTKTKAPYSQCQRAQSRLDPTATIYFVSHSHTVAIIENACITLKCLKERLGVQKVLEMKTTW